MTILNLFFLLAAIFHLLGGVSGFIGVHPKKDSRHKELIVAFSYVGIAVSGGITDKYDSEGPHPGVFCPGARLHDAAPSCFGNCGDPVQYFRPSAAEPVSFFSNDTFILVHVGLVSPHHRVDLLPTG